MTPEQIAAWLGEFISKNNAKLTELQRQNFQLAQQTLLSQKQTIDEYLRSIRA